MDLNDPRRRLQVLNNSNPSLRVSVAKPSQPKITVAQQPVNQPRLIVPQSPQRTVPNVPENRFKAIQLDEGKNKTIFGWNAAALLPKSLEKTYGVNTKDVDFGSADEFLKYFDTRDDQFRRAYVNKMQKDAQNDPVAARTLKLLQERGRFKGNVSDFMEGANDKLYGGIGRGIMRGADFVLPGKNTFGLERLADQQDPSKTGTQQFSTAGRVGEQFGSAEKAVFDLATLVVGAGAAEKAATKLPAFASAVDKLQKGGRVSQIAARGLGILPGSFAGSGIDVLQTAGRGDEQNVAKSFGIGTAVDLGVPVLGKVLGKGFNLFKGKGSKTMGFVEDLIGETNPTSIKNALGNIDDDMATYLAQETNPETVRQVLAEMAVDPNINLTDDVRKRLQDEGITAVRREDNPYGAAYNTEDASISVRGQADATDANMYHELGHHVYLNKLTPEERAMFAGINGRAAQEAAGRAGYTADDIAAEDFSDFMRLALTGRMGEVPESVRPVIQKYAKVAQQEAANAKMNEFRSNNNGKPFTKAQQKELEPYMKAMEDGLNKAKQADAELNPTTQVTPKPTPSKSYTEPKATIQEGYVPTTKTSNAPKYGLKRPELEGKLSPEDAMIQAGIDSGHNGLAGTGKGTKYNAALSDLTKSQREYVQKSASSYYLSGDPVFQERVNAYARGSKPTPPPKPGVTQKPKTAFEQNVPKSYTQREIPASNQRTIDSYSTPKPVTEYKVGEKVSNATAQGGTVDGTIVKTPDFSKDLRYKGNNFEVKLSDGTTVKTDGAGFDNPTTPPKSYTEGKADPNRNWKLSNQVDDGHRTFDDAKKAANAGIALPNPTSTEMKSSVKTQIDRSLVDEGLVDGKIYNAKLNDLKLGSDTVGDIDINQVSKYIEDISNGKPIAPVIVQRGPNGELFVQDGKHRLEALKTLGIEDVPYTEKVVKQADEVQQAVTDVAQKQTGTADNMGQLVDDAVENVENVGGDAAQAVAPTVNQNADEAAQRFSAFEPEVQTQLNKIMDELPNAQKSYDDAAKLRSKEKAGRIQAGNAAYEAAGGGEAGVRAKMGALKGEYSKSGFNPVQADEATQQSILDTIEKSDLRDFEKLNTQNAMRKIWGSADGKPTTSDINYIRKFFGEDMAKAVEDAVEEGGTKGWRDVLSNIAGIPRAAMSTLDFSMGGRQGAPVAVRNLKEWASANADSIKYATSNETYEKAMKAIQDDDAYELMVDKMGIRFPAIGKEAMEGDFISSDYIEKIPLYGSKGVAGSRRAYDGGLTKLRYNIAKKWVDDFGGVDTFMKSFSEKEMKDLGEVINTFTGSGGKKGGMIDQHMKTLSNTLFAPRFWAANLNRLNPVFYARLSPVARKEALKYQSSFYALAGSVLALASAAGAEVVWDPRSADFAKIKVGNTRYDILGGQQQNIRLAAQLATGQKIDSTTGELRDLGEGFVGTRKEIIADTFEGKANPLLGYAMRMLDVDSEGNNKYGEHVNPLLEAAKLGVPLNFQGIVETTKDRGNLVAGVGMNLPGFFGAGVQTYGPVETKNKAADGGYKGKITDDMVLDNSGQPMLDEKGKVIKAKFTDDMSDMERQAAVKTKQNEAYRAKAKSLLSKDDMGIYRMGEADRDSLTPEQQKKYDQISKWIKDYGQKQEIPEGVKSQVATTFYNKYNSMTKDDQENWLKESPDDNAKTVAELLNKERVQNLSEFKPSNELTKAYAEYEKDINSHPEYTEFDLRKKAREFQKFAYKLNYSTDQRDLYSANIGDVKYMINEKMLSKEDLDAAIKMDDEMYNAGLISDLKFSKKFRKEYGYGLPSGGGKNENLASGGGSGDDTPRTYIANLLPSFKQSGGERPIFSSKRRTTGISFKNVTTPKAGGKKVSINL